MPTNKSNKYKIKTDTLDLPILQFKISREQVVDINILDPVASICKKKLTDLLQKEYSLENLSFLEELYKVSMETNKSDLKIGLNNIMRTYIEPSGEKQINIPSEQFNALHEAWNNGKGSLLISDFNDAVKEIARLISVKFNSPTQAGELKNAYDMGNILSNILSQLKDNIDELQISARLTNQTKQPGFFSKQKIDIGTDTIRKSLIVAKDTQKELIQLEKKAPNLKMEDFNNHLSDIMNRHFTQQSNLEQSMPNRHLHAGLVSSVKYVGDSVVNLKITQEKKVNERTALPKLIKR